jgi:hypothetical protein
MLATLIPWLEANYPGRDFVLSSNTFAVAAHRAYEALGFKVAETRWHFDREVADALWKADQAQRDRIASHIRFLHGRWEVRLHIFRRKRGAAMRVPRVTAAAPSAAR